LKDGTQGRCAIEPALLVYHFALSLGLKKAHFEDRKDNQSVKKFHERLGAIKISLETYKKYLPNEFLINY
jgi:hypothetical protein